MGKLHKPCLFFAFIGLWSGGWALPGALTHNMMQWEYIVTVIISFVFASGMIWASFPEKENVNPGEGYYIIDIKNDIPKWDDEFYHNGIWLSKEAGTACFSKDIIYRRSLHHMYDK